MDRVIVLIFLCAVIVVTSGWSFDLNGSKQCLNYRSGRLLSLLIENAGEANFNDMLESVCQSIGDELPVCVKIILN